MTLLRKKSLTALMSQAADAQHGLQRSLGPMHLIALGIGAIIGAGLFVRTAAAAGEAAGAGVTLSFIIAAIGCAFAGLCYAEFAAMIPISGSAYAYAYVTLGELIAWIIGWALVLEYALGAATVANAWTEYFNRMLEVFFHFRIPYEWSHTPMDSITNPDGTVGHGILNVPAIGILAALTALLIKGTKEAAWVNALIVFLKVAIVIAFIAVGWGFINPANHDPYMIPATAPGHEGFFQHGFGGVMRGASIVFFAFIGFDAVSTAAQEAKRPERTMPIGILGSLAICTVLYILFSHVLTGVAPWTDFQMGGKGEEASVAYAIATYMHGYDWLADAVTLAILAGFSSVILVMLLGQSRVFYSMAKDGLLPPVFAELHPRFRTPWKSNMLLFAFVATFAGLVPERVCGNLTSIGTLFAFVIVCAGVIVMRQRDPAMARPFRTPLVPAVPILGAIVCALMIGSLDSKTQLVALAWMAFGLLIYFGYSRKHSKHAA